MLLDFNNYFGNLFQVVWCFLESKLFVNPLILEHDDYITGNTFDKLKEKKIENKLVSIA